MKNKLFVVLVAVAALLAVRAPLFAHHGESLYDAHHLITLAGTVTKFEMINPHALIHFDVKDDKGNIEHWTAQGTAPNNLRRVGWTRDSLKPGDQITVSGYPYKDG